MSCVFLNLPARAKECCHLSLPASPNCAENGCSCSCFRFFCATITDKGANGYTVLRREVPTVFLVLWIFILHGELDNINTQHKLF